MQKKKITIITALFIAVLTGSYFVAANLGYFSGGTNAPSVPEDTMTRGLVGYWSFDEGVGQTVYDGSNNSNNGTLGASSAVGSDDPLWTADGKSAGGMNFDGVNDYVNFGDVYDMGTNDMTISMWYKTTDTEYSLINKSLYASTNNRYFLIDEGAGLYISFAGSSKVETTPVTGYNDGLWHNVVVVFDRDGLMKLYLDNVFKESNNISAQSAHDMQSSHHLFLGRYNDDVAGQLPHSTFGILNGAIDEVRIYNRALSADEIRYHYNRGGPVAYWNFNEGSGQTAYDSTENNNDGIFGDGTCVAGSGTCPSWVEGRYGGGLSFDGGDYVNVSNPSNLQITGNITVSTWFNFSASQLNRPFVSKWGTDEAYLLSIDHTTTNAIVFAIRVSDVNKEAVSLNTYNDGQWHYATGVFNGTNVLLYIDGGKEAITGDATTGPIDNPVSGVDLIFGNYNNFPGGWFNGITDDVRIYDYARTADEIRLDYNAGLAVHLGPTEKTCSEDPASCTDYGLVGYWNMDEGTGLTAYDGSGNGNDGTLTGDPKWTTDSAPLQSGAGGGSALDFDGENDYVNITDDPTLDPGAGSFTISFWNKLNAVEGTVGLTNWDIHIGKRDVANRGYYIGTNRDVDTGTKFMLGNTDSVRIDTPYIPCVYDEWVHFVAVLDRTDNIMKLYKNAGNMVYEIPPTGIINPPNDLSIGADSGVGDYWTHGLIDEVRIYNRALSVEEIRYVYNKGGPIAQWNFNEGSGQTVYDSTSNNNDGTIYGAIGTANSGTTTTLTDAKSWIADEWVGETVTIHTGTCSTVPRTITDNDATSITVSDWNSCTPDTTSQYKITSKNEWTTGKLDSAISFDGDDYVEIVHDSNFDITSDITISAWIKRSLNGGSDYDLIMSKSNGSNGSNYDYEIGFCDSCCSGSDELFFYAPNLSPTFTCSNTLAVSDIINWHHIVITRTGTSVKYYVDKINIGNTIMSGSFSANNVPVYIGSEGATGGYFRGSIDDVRIYDYARTPEQIQIDYNAGLATHLGPTEKTCSEDPASCTDYGLVGYWNMDEGTGLTAYDGSGNGNDGTLTGDPKWTTDSAPLRGGAGTGSALEFDGEGNYINVGDIDLGDTFSFSAWIMNKDSGDFTNNRIISKKLNWSAVDGWGLVLKSSGLSLDYIGIMLDGANFVTLNTGGEWDKEYLNSWVHIVITIAGTNAELFCDGVSTDSDVFPADGIIVDNNQDLLIGRLISEASNSFLGPIDEVRIYNRVLSEEEIRHLYNKGEPIAQWNFDEGEGTTAYDSTNNDNDGTFGDGTCVAGVGTCPSWVEGKYGSGLDFDGGDDYVEVASSSALEGTGDTTICFWMNADKIQTTSNWIGILSRYNSTEADRCWNFAIPTTSTLNYVANDLNFWVSPDGGTANGKGVQIDIATKMSINKWYHVCGRYDGSAISIYLDGLEEMTKAYSSGIHGDSESIVIGNYRAFTESFNGTIDDIRVYNHARTLEQIRLDYQRGLATHFK